MKLFRLEARNFKKLRLDVAVEFGEGLTLISGLNESGKSSILDAVLYALFGRVVRPPRAKIEDLISYRADEASIVLDFEVADRQFRVTRHLHRTKPTRADLDERTNLPPKRIATGHEHVNEEIVKLLGGITYHEIISSTVVAQKELSKLIDLNKDDRRKIVNVFLNLDSFNQVTDELTQEKRDLEGTSSRQGRIQTETQRLNSLNSELAQFKQAQQEHVNVITQQQELARTINVLQAKNVEQNQLYEALVNYDLTARTKEKLVLQLDVKRQLLLDHTDRAQQIRTSIRSIESQLNTFSAVDGSNSSLELLPEKLSILNLKRTELKSAEHSWHELREQMSTFQANQFASKPYRSQQLKPMMPYLIGSMVLVLATVTSAILTGPSLMTIALGFSIVLPLAILAVRVNTATRIAKHTTEIAELQQLDKTRKETDKAHSHFEQLKREVETDERLIAVTCETLPQYSETFSKNLNLGIYSAAQKVLETSNLDKTKKRELEIRLQTMITELEKIGDTTEIQAEILQQKQEIDKIKFPPLPNGIVFSSSLLSKTLSVKDDLTKQLASTQARLDQNIEQIRILDKYLHDHHEIEINVQSQQQIVDKMERQLKVINRALEGLRVTSESLRERIRPSVQAYMSSILPALTSSQYTLAMLDENYNVKVWDPEAGEYKPREVYSGGAEDQFLLAMRLSFALALLPEVKGQKPEFVFLDEPLASSDEIRRSGIIEYLSSELTKKFKQIFIISHVGVLESNVQNVIRLTDGRIEQTSV